MNSLVAAVAVIVKISPGLWPADGGSEVLGSSHLAVAGPMDSAAHAPWSHLAVEAIAMLVQAPMDSAAPRTTGPPEDAMGMLVHSATSVPTNAVATSITQHAAEHACQAAWIDAQPNMPRQGADGLLGWGEHKSRRPRFWGLPSASPHMHATIASYPQSCPPREPPHAVDAIRGPIAAEMETQR